jgi:predicted Co/Zn/Cd cation transporter (cation efflux family)
MFNTSSRLTKFSIFDTVLPTVRHVGPVVGIMKHNHSIFFDILQGVFSTELIGFFCISCEFILSLFCSTALSHI